MTKEEVKHIAHLSRLSFTEEKLDEFAPAFEHIIAMVDTLLECPVDDITEAEQQYEGFLRPDVVKPSIPRDILLAGAPAKEAGCVVTPRTIETEEN